MLENYKDVLNFKEFKEILRLGRNKSYQLLRTEKVKSIKIGTNYRIPKINVINYLQGDD